MMSLHEPQIRPERVAFRSKEAAFQAWDWSPPRSATQKGSCAVEICVELTSGVAAWVNDPRRSRQAATNRVDLHFMTVSFPR
jgi:hypothetical protein